MTDVKYSIKRKDIFTIPNGLSLLRLLLVPIIVWLYAKKQNYPVSIALIAVSGLSDIADGYLARRFNWVSDVGKVLDPLADKLTQCALIVCLLSRHAWMWGLIGLFIAKESLMALWGYHALQMDGSVNSAKWYGKVCTVVLYTTMGLLILWPSMPGALANALILLCGGFMALSLVMYGRFYCALLEKTEPDYRKRLLGSVWKAFVASLWATVILYCLMHKDEITARMLSYSPPSAWLALLVVCGLFALKSLVFVFYAGFLYALSGVLFSQPWSIPVNLLGMLIMYTLPYLIGRHRGTELVDSLSQRYKRLAQLQRLRRKNAFLALLALRGIKLLPLDVVSMYLGAARITYLKYLLVSYLAELPTMIAFSFMGNSVTGLNSPAFIIGLALEVVSTVVSVVAYSVYYKKHSRDAE